MVLLPVLAEELVWRALNEVPVLSCSAQSVPALFLHLQFEVLPSAGPIKQRYGSSKKLKSEIYIHLPFSCFIRQMLREREREKGREDSKGPSPDSIPGPCDEASAYMI